MAPSSEVDGLLRRCAPQALGVLVRRYGHFDSCEDAVQEAMLAASRQWPADGVPEHPRAWLLPVASRRLTDELRAQTARRAREDALALAQPPAALVAPAADAEPEPEHDDTLELLLLCCHPSLSEPSQLALTLRAVGGLSTEQIAAAFLVPETTMGQRISRAKASIRKAGARFSMPAGDELEDAMRVVLHVLYLIFNEGYAATSGAELARAELTGEAIRLTREVRRRRPRAGAAAGLLARGEIDAVVVGTDRVAANGDVANKVGTYGHALAARAADRPFVVSGPTSSIDAALVSGAEIVIEERDPGEVLGFGGVDAAPPGTPVRNPAFDVTPAALVSALVTERGIASPVGSESVAALIQAR